MKKLVDFFICIKVKNNIQAFTTLQKNQHFVNMECNGNYAIEYAILKNNIEMFYQILKIKHNYGNILNMLVSYPISYPEYFVYFKEIFLKYKHEIEKNNDVEQIMRQLIHDNRIEHVRFLFELGYNPKKMYVYELENVTVYDTIKCYRLLELIDMIEYYYPYEIRNEFDKLLFCIRKKEFDKAKRFIEKDKNVVNNMKPNRKRNIDCFVLGNAVLYDIELKFVPYLLTIKHNKRLIEDALMMTREYHIFKYITDNYKHK